MKANDLDHERCSELLGPFVRGELAPPDEEAVRGHLQVCESCAEERRGLERLLAEEIEPLSELERTRLRSSISEAIGRARPSRRSWGARLAPALGVAALTLLVAAGIYGALQGTDEESSGGATFEAVSPAPESNGEGGGGQGAADKAVTKQGESLTAGAAGRTSRARPVFEPNLGAFTLDDLRRAGRTGGLFVTFASTYTNSDATDLEKRYLTTLSERAPSPSAAEQTRRCGNAVLQSLGDPVLAAFGAHGVLRRGDTTRDALLLGFAYSSGDRGALDRFMFWVWPRDDCEAPLDYVSARIKR
jgi:hypothetical protein